jgi:hypothetical protein
MANPFNQKIRKGTVCGIEVCARPVPFGVIRRMLDSERTRDDSAKLLCMADTVSQCVTYADGSPVSADDLDAETIGKLFAFASGAKADADFTETALPAGGDPAQT